MRVVCLLYPQSSMISSVAETFLQWTPQVAVTFEAVFLEISRCQRLYTESALLLRIRRLNKQFGFTPRIAIANDAPTALAMARFQTSRRDELPIMAILDYFSPWESSTLLNPMIDSLKKLGILWLKDFLALPVQALSCRFGKEGVEVIRKIKEVENLLWPRFILPEKIIEKKYYESEELAHLEPLLFASKCLIDRAMNRLKGRGEKASIIEFLIIQEAYSTVKEPERKWQIKLSIPQGKAAGLLQILKERLETDLAKKPLETPVISLSFQILESTPAKEAERHLFNKKEEDQEAWESLVARLCEKIGRDRVYRASPTERYLPEKGWMKALDESQNLNQPFPLRPLRIYSNPRELSFQGKTLVSGKKRWEMVNIEGPERLSGEWWQETLERDYFKVRTQLGEELWIFRIIGTPQYFLHGLFD